MNLKSERRLRSIKHGYRNRLDPGARERQIANLLSECFEKRGWLLSGSKELSAATYCAGVFLQDVTALNRLDLWNYLQTSGPPFPPPPDKDLATARQRLKSPEASMYDLIAGMDLASMAVRSMTSRFPSAKFHPDEDWDSEEADENDEPEEEEYDEKEERKRE